MAEAKNEVATTNFSSEKRAVEGTSECAGKDEEDGGGFLPQFGDFTRTNTDVTLVGGNEENGGLLALKALQFLPIDGHVVNS